MKNTKNNERIKQARERIKHEEVVLFGLSGKMAAGKDTIGEKVSQELLNQGFWIEETSFGYIIRKEIEDVIKAYNSEEDLTQFSADLKDIKTLVDIMKGFNIFERSEQSRKALQFWGTDVRRNQNNEYWIDKMEEFLVDSILKGKSVNVTDSRFPNEVDLIRKLGGKVIRLEIPEHVQIQRIKERDNIDVDKKILHHHSEVALDNYPFEVVYDGTKEPTKLTNSIISYLLQ